MNSAQKIKLITLVFIFSVSSNQAYANRWTEGLDGLKSIFSRGKKEASKAEPRERFSPPPAAKNTDNAAHQAAGQQDNFVFEHGLVPVKADPSIQNDEEMVENIVFGLMSSKKATKTIVAPAGRGKSAGIEGLKHMIDSKDQLVKPLWGKELVFFNASKLIENTSWQGSFENRIQKMLAFVNDPRNADVIIVIDEFESLIKESKNGGPNLGIKLLDELKSYMAGDMPVKFIFNITDDAWHKYLYDKQYLRRLKPTFLKPLDDAIVLSILRKNAKSYEFEGGVTFTDGQLKDILKISKEHPTLANPDVAVTILDGAYQRSTFDKDVMDTRIAAKNREIRRLDAIITEIEGGRRRGEIKYSGPYYIQKLYDAKEKRLPLVKDVENYNSSINQTEELRYQINLKIKERAELNARHRANQANDDFGGEEEEMIDLLNQEISNLTQQIREINPGLVFGSVENRHIVSAGAESLNINVSRLENLVGQGSTIAATSSRISKSIQNSNIQGITSIIERERTLRRPGDQKIVPAFLILSDRVDDADALAEAVIKDLTDSESYKIDVSTIDSPWAMSKISGSDSGTVNSDIEGAIFQRARTSSGNMGIVFSGVQNAISDVFDFAKTIIRNKSLVNNKTSENVSFAKSTVFLTAKLPEPLSVDELQTLKFLKTELERQVYLRRIVQNALEGRSGRQGTTNAKMDEELLENLHIIVLDDVNVSDSILRAKLGESVIDKIQKKLAQEIEITFDFTEGALDYLYEYMKAVGVNKVDDVVDYLLISKILKAVEQKSIISGDSVIINFEKNQFFILKRKWPDGVDRNAAKRQIFGEDEMSNALDKATKLK